MAHQSSLCCCCFALFSHEAQEDTSALSLHTKAPAALSCHNISVHRLPIRFLFVLKLMACSLHNDCVNAINLLICVLLVPLILAMQVLWALCVYLEAVSVLPQLRMMQKAKVVEKFTAHYVFALGISRFISCAHWILQIIDGDSFLLQAIGSGIWPAMVLLSEVVQTGILADFW